LRLHPVWRATRPALDALMLHASQVVRFSNNQLPRSARVLKSPLKS
jgi:hypothetical protein